MVFSVVLRVNMNEQEKTKYRRYMSLCSKKMLHEMKRRESFSEEETDELRCLKKDLGGDHEEIIAVATSILIGDVTGEA